MGELRAVAAAVVVVGLLGGTLLKLCRRFRPLRSFWFPAFLRRGAGLRVADLLRPRLAGVHEIVLWVVFLGIIALAIRLLAVYFFDFVLQHRRRVDLPPSS
ncbi:MAG: hypothetical protein R2991_13670 [Thermoanaerobaculia bacterium]